MFIYGFTHIGQPIITHIVKVIKRNSESILTLWKNNVNNTKKLIIAKNFILIYSPNTYVHVAQVTNVHIINTIKCCHQLQGFEKWVLVFMLE